MEKGGFVDLGSPVPFGPPTSEGQPLLAPKGPLRFGGQRSGGWENTDPLQCGEVSCTSARVHSAENPQLMAFNNTALKY